MQGLRDHGTAPGSLARSQAGWGHGAAALVVPDFMARFHGRLGASGRRYHFTRYDCHDDIADFSNILIFALDAQRRPCSLAHVDHDGGIRHLPGIALSRDAPTCWDIRFLPLDHAAAEAVILDLTRLGDA